MVFHLTKVKEDGWHDDGWWKYDQICDRCGHAICKATDGIMHGGKPDENEEHLCGVCSIETKGIDPAHVIV